MERHYSTAIRWAAFTGTVSVSLSCLLLTDMLFLDWPNMDFRTRAPVWIAGAACLLALTAAFRARLFARRGRLLRQDLTQARNLADDTNRAKSDFLASMSHEIRTPLNSVIGYSELLFDGPLSAEQRRYVERIHFAGSALLTVVNDVLDFSKVEAGRLEITPYPFSLTVLIDNTVSLMHDLARRKGLALTVSVDPNLPPALIGDEARIRQILLNLLNNAVKFTPEGDVALNVGGHRTGESFSVRFSVTDTGVGIAEEDRGKLFQQFSQLTARRSAEPGTGLGLAISKRLVDLMQGRIGFESRLGKGSTFWFEIPLPTADPQLLQQARIQPQSATRPGRVLLVEDLEHNRELAEKILSTAGHSVDIAQNGAEAVASVQKSDYDIILMDVQMPVLDGVAATREIRTLQHRVSTIPILAMSANVLPDQVRRYKEAGMNGHIGKPFKRAELLIAVNEWLGKRVSESNGSSDVSENGEDPMEEVCETMGRDWVAGGLRRLKQEFSDLIDPQTDHAPEEIAFRAHRLIAHAGLLGFTALSDSCRELETACAPGGDRSAALERVARFAQQAEARADEWLRLNHFPLGSRA